MVSDGVDEVIRSRTNERQTNRRDTDKQTDRQRHVQRPTKSKVKNCEYELETGTKAFLKVHLLLCDEKFCGGEIAETKAEDFFGGGLHTRKKG